MSFDSIVYKLGEIFCSGVFKVSPKIAYEIGCVTDESASVAILLQDDSFAPIANYGMGLFFGIFLLIIGIPIIVAIIDATVESIEESKPSLFAVLFVIGVCVCIFLELNGNETVLHWLLNPILNFLN